MFFVENNVNLEREGRSPEIFVIQSFSSLSVLLECLEYIEQKSVGNWHSLNYPLIILKKPKDIGRLI